MALLLTIYVVQALAFGFLAGNLSDSKGGSYGSGFALGFFLGVVGVIYVAAASPRPSLIHATLSEGEKVSNSRPIYGTDFEISSGQKMTVISADKHSATVRLTDGSERILPRSMLVEALPEPIALKSCPRCAEDVKAAASVCRYCGHEFG